MGMTHTRAALWPTYFFLQSRVLSQSIYFVMQSAQVNLRLLEALDMGDSITSLKVPPFPLLL